MWAFARQLPPRAILLQINTYFGRPRERFNDIIHNKLHQHYCTPVILNAVCPTSSYLPAPEDIDELPRHVPRRFRSQVEGRAGDFFRSAPLQARVWL